MQQRQCIILMGDSKGCYQSVQTLLTPFNHSQCLIIADNKYVGITTLSQNQALSQLGKEFEAVVFDGLSLFNLDSFAAVMGTVKAGGLFILMLPTEQAESVFLQRFMQISQQFEQQYSSFHIIQQGQELPYLPPFKSIKDNAVQGVYITEDQQQAVKAILKVVNGHRQRPLVLSSDRGRGKSASLGIAAAELLLAGKQNIIVTAPSLATVNTLFEHAGQCLPKADKQSGLIHLNNAEIRFIAPDALITIDLNADLVLVDEAAAIPTSMLTQLLNRYSRLVFATTLHGYEGTGRGFALRFQAILDQQTPDWRQYHMTTPIRWADDDHLEAFSFQSLLLNAQAVDDQLLADFQHKQCHFEQLDQQQLAHNEQDLTALFGLMVLAHYRTRPSDLQMLLDRDDMSIYVMRYQGHIVATAWLVAEGGLDDQLSADIYAGKRRLKGHLLPQSLLAHAGITEAGELNYQRVIRIAVHPAIQRQGLGKTLLTTLLEQVQDKGVDIIGTSFGLDDNVLAFWQSAGFKPVRLGTHRDEVSGSWSVMLLQGLSKQGQQLVTASQQRFSEQWPYLLTQQFAQLDVGSVIALSQMITVKEPTLTDYDQADIKGFADQQRSYEASQVALWQHLKTKLCQPDFIQLTDLQQAVIVMKVIQQHNNIDVVKQLKLQGKSHLITLLREAVQRL